MRKLLFIVVLLFGCSALMAQTNFRDITYEEAVAAAKAENKLVFIDVYASWCGPCKMMSEEVFPQKSMGDYFNPRFVCIKIDAEKGEGVELAKRFNVRAYPTFVILDANGEVMGSKVGGSRDVESFTASIERVINPEKSPERLKARYDGGERTADLVLSYSFYLLDEATKTGQVDQAKVDSVRQMVLDYFNGLTDKQKLAAENLFVYQRYASSPVDAYGRYMGDHRDEFDPAIREEIKQCLDELYMGYIYNTLSGNGPYDAEDYATVKKEMNELGYNDDKRFDPVFRLIESYAEGDLNAFLDCCEEEYDNLDETGQFNLVYGINNLVKTDDPVILKRVARFLRSHLSTMSVNGIYIAVSILGQIESQIPE